MSAPAPRKRRRFKKQTSERPPVVPFDPVDDAAVCYSRESHYTDESTSNVVQRDTTHRWTSAYDIPVVATVEDLHVSGDLEPHKRAGLKQWLSDAPPQPWKTLVVSKLDRLVRNVMDALNLLEWLRARGKRLIAIAEGIDSSNSMAEFMITLIAAFARMERERMRERFRSAKASLKEQGRWSGESHLYGTMPVELPGGGGWILGLDPYAVKILHSLSTLVRAEKKGLADLCKWLTENKVVTPRDRQAQLTAERRGEDPATIELKGYKWQSGTLAALLVNPELVELGIFEPAEQAEIAAVLDEKSRRKERGSNRPYPFSGVLVCPECFEPLWHRIAGDTRTRANGTQVSYEYRYWRCPTAKHGPSIRAEDVEPFAEKSFYVLFSMVPVRERIVMPPSNHANEIAKLEREHARLMSRVARAVSTSDRQQIMEDGNKILKDIDTLRALPIDPGGVQWVPTDRTWREELETLTPEERRIRWLDLGFAFAAQKRPDGKLVMGWLLPEGWQDAMPELAEFKDKYITENGIIDITNLVS
ncbi:hypothetical protein DMH01_10475 [Amycolatopsis sp. WAC 04182]|uniref:recombinase family protein n=1 Tax=Amycolatopsis sp. WAC 04182 TaxID=2203198 RepID=UPI000F7BAEBE|nr:recombinase family protein [Amycolatopsis sp. WAC 04182]RSN63031.1 hypothetical protein DMH01_10475 [Amycolatopsis sp. WAC 04182]